LIKKGKLYVIIAYLLFNVYQYLAYFFTRRSGRFGSSTAAGGASPNAGGAVPKSTAAGAVSTCTVIFTGAAGGGVGAVGWAHVCSVLYPCVGGEGLIHCGC